MTSDRARPKHRAQRTSSKRFGPQARCSTASISTFERGESLVVIGGSGTGKSVMIKCILGILQPDAGSILVDGEEVVGLRGRQRDKVLRAIRHAVPGRRRCSIRLPVWQNVAFGLIQGRGDAPRARPARSPFEKLGQVGLGPEVAELFPAELSGGMQKRVGLARAIAADPEIIFFDEPTTGLDPIMADVINDLIVDCVKRPRRHRRSRSPTTWPSARKIADDIAMIYKGKIIWQGPAAEIDDSGNPYVEQFIHGRAEGPIQMEVRR